MLRYFLLFLFSLICLVYAKAQENIPYSRFGLGEIQETDFVTNRAMGNLSATFHDKYRVNFSNPASYSSLEFTSFETALSFNFSTISDKSSSLQSSDVFIPYMVLGLPLAKWWGTAFGIMPYSKMSYNIENITANPILDSITYRFSGQGRLNQLFWGNGFRLFNIDQSFIDTLQGDSLIFKQKHKKHSLSFGYNLSYLFGSLNYTNLTLFKDINTFDLRNTNNTSLANVIWNVGLQYKLGLGNKTDLTIGISGQTATNIKPQRNEIWERVSVSALSILIEDTTSVLDTSGKITLPMTLNIGFQLNTTNSKGATWILGSNFKYTQWSGFKSIDDIDTSLTNNYKFSFGGTYIPKRKDNKYLSKLIISLGMHYGTNRLKLNNIQDNEYGMNFGVILPLRWALSTINLAFEVGKKGNINKSLISENYFRILAGFTLNDKWFVKRKFD